MCVADEHRRKGLGSQMLRELCKDTRDKGAQSIAVFTGPTSRLFFWRNGFRLDFRYRVRLSRASYHVLNYCANIHPGCVQVMVYQPLKTQTDQPPAKEATVSDLNEVFGTRYM